MKRIVSRIDVYQLTNETHVEFHQEINRVLNLFDLDKLGLKPLNEKRLAAFQVEKSVLDIVFASPITPEIRKQDHVRDSIYRGLVHAVKSARHHFDEKIVKAAERIDLILHSYGNIAAKTLDAESAAIEDLVRELNTTENVPQVALLQLTNWVNKLEDANDDLRDLMHERYDEKAQLPVIRMREARSATDHLYHLLINQVETFVAIDGVEMYEPLIKALNVTIDRYKAIMAQQKASKGEK